MSGAPIVVVKDNEFHRLKKKLEALSYMQPLDPKSAPLVSRLLADLLLATQSNQDLEVSVEKQATALDVLQAEVSPLRHENGRLVRENNQLHLELIRQAEDFERREQGWKQEMRRNEANAKDAAFISSQNQKLVDKYEAELETLRGRLAQSLDRNLVAERPAISALGGVRGDPVVIGTGIEGTGRTTSYNNAKEKGAGQVPIRNAGESSRSESSGSRHFPKALEWSGAKQNIAITQTLMPSPKRKSATRAKAADPGTSTTPTEAGREPQLSSEDVAVTSHVVEDLTASLKSTRKEVESLQIRLDDLQQSSNRALAARDGEIDRLSKLIEHNGLSIVGGGLNPPLLHGGLSSAAANQQQIRMIEQLNDQVDFQADQLARREATLAKLQKKLRETQQAKTRAEKHGSASAGSLLEKDTEIQELKKQLEALNEEPSGVVPKLRAQVAALTEEKQTLEASLSRAVRAVQEGEATSQSLRSSAHEADARARKAEAHAIQQSGKLKQVTSELSQVQTRVEEMERREQAAKREWEVGLPQLALLNNDRLSFLFLHCISHSFGSKLFSVPSNILHPLHS